MGPWPSASGQGPRPWQRGCDFASEPVTEREPSVADGLSTCHGFSLYLCPLHTFTHRRVARNGLAASRCEVCVCTWGRLRRKPVSLRGLPPFVAASSVPRVQDAALLTGWPAAVCLRLWGRDLTAFYLQGGRGLWGPDDKTESDHRHHRCFSFLFHTIVDSIQFNHTVTWETDQGRRSGMRGLLEAKAIATMV